MKRLLTVALAAAAVAAIPAVATGAGGVMDGSTKQAGLTPMKKLPGQTEFGFDYLSVNGKVTKVRNFEMRQLPVKCKGNTVREIKFKINKLAAKKNNKFVGKSQNKKRKIRVTGKINVSGGSAKGTVKAKGQFGKDKKCKSGKLKWVAKKKKKA